MTEEEATSKICCGPEGCGNPVYGTGNAMGNFLQSMGNGAVFPSSQLDALRYSDAQPRLIEKTCIASACMAWRWKAVDMRAYQGTAAKVRPGYCGLAGEQS